MAEPLSLSELIRDRALQQPPTALERANPIPMSSDEVEQDALRREAQGLTEFGKGFRSGIEGMYGGVQELAGTAAEAAGAKDFPRAAYAAAERNSLRAQALAPRVQDTADINDGTDFGHYVAGNIGNAFASTLPGMAAGAGWGLRAALAARSLGAAGGRGAFGAGAAAMFPQEAGEFAGRSRKEDPYLDADARLMMATGVGAMNAALENVVPHMGLRALTQPGGAMFRGGPGRAAAGVGARITGGIATEGATEATQEAMQQQGMNVMHPERDRSGDMRAIQQAGYAGAAGGGGLIAPHAVARGVFDAIPEQVIEKGGELVGKGVDLAKGGVEYAQDIAARGSEAGAEKVTTDTIVAGASLAKAIKEGAAKGASLLDVLTTRGRGDPVNLADPNVLETSVTELRDMIKERPHTAKKARDLLLDDDLLPEETKAKLAALNNFADPKAIKELQKAVKQWHKLANAKQDAEDLRAEMNEGTERTRVNLETGKTESYSREKTAFHKEVGQLFPNKPEVVDELASLYQRWEDNPHSFPIGRMFRAAADAGLSEVRLGQLEKIITGLPSKHRAEAREVAMAAQRPGSALSGEIRRIIGGENKYVEDALTEYANDVLFPPKTEDLSDRVDIAKKGRTRLVAFLQRRLGIEGKELNDKVNALVKAFTTHYTTGRSPQSTEYMKGRLQSAFHVPGDTASAADIMVNNLTDEARQKLEGDLGEDADLTPNKEGRKHHPDIISMAHDLMQAIADTKRIGVANFTKEQKQAIRATAAAQSTTLAAQGKTDEAREAKFAGERKIADRGASIGENYKALQKTAEKMFGKNMRTVMRDLNALQATNERELQQLDKKSADKGGNPALFTYRNAPTFSDEAEDLYSFNYDDSDDVVPGFEADEQDDGAKQERTRQNESGTHGSEFSHMLVGSNMPIYRSERQGGEIERRMEKGSFAGARTETMDFKKFLSLLNEKERAAIEQKTYEAVVKQETLALKTITELRAKYEAAGQDPRKVGRKGTLNLVTMQAESEQLLKDAAKYTPTEFFGLEASSGSKGKVVVASTSKGTEADITANEFDRLLDDAESSKGNASKNFLVLRKNGTRSWVNAERLTRLMLSKTQEGETVRPGSDTTVRAKVLAAFNLGISNLMTGGLLNKNNPMAYRPENANPGATWAEKPKKGASDFAPQLVLFSKGGPGRTVHGIETTTPITFGAASGNKVSPANQRIVITSKEAEGLVEAAPFTDKKIDGKYMARARAQGKLPYGVNRDKKFYTVDLNKLMVMVAEKMGIEGLDQAIARTDDSVGISRGLAYDLLTRGMAELEKRGYAPTTKGSIDLSWKGDSNQDTVLFSYGEAESRNPVTLKKLRVFTPAMRKELNLSEYKYPGDYSLEQDRRISLQEYRNMLIETVVPEDMRGMTTAELKRILKPEQVKGTSVNTLEVAEQAANRQRKFHPSTPVRVRIASHMLRMRDLRERLDAGVNDAEAASLATEIRGHVRELRNYLAGDAKVEAKPTVRGVQSTELTESMPSAKLTAIGQAYRKLAWADRELSKLEGGYDRMTEVDYGHGAGVSEIEHGRIRDAQREPEGATEKLEAGAETPAYDKAREQGPATKDQLKQDRTRGRDKKAEELREQRRLLGRQYPANPKPRAAQYARPDHAPTTEEALAIAKAVKKLASDKGLGFSSISEQVDDILASEGATVREREYLGEEQGYSAKLTDRKITTAEVVRDLTKLRTALEAYTPPVQTPQEVRVPPTVAVPKREAFNPQDLLDAQASGAVEEVITEEKLADMFGVEPTITAKAETPKDGIPFRKGGTAPSGSGITEKDKNAVRARLTILLQGFHKLAFGHGSDWSGRVIETILASGDIERLVEVSTMTLDPLGTANHEAWHVIESVLKQTKEGRDLIEMVHAATSTPLMRAWLNKWYTADRAALDQMNKDANQASERASYAFQLFAAGKKMPAPEKVKGVFNRIVDFFKRVLQITPDRVKMLKLFRAFDSGQFIHEVENPEALSRYMAHTKTEAFAQKAKEALEPLGELARKTLSTTVARVRDIKNPAYQEVVDRYIGKTQAQGGFFYERRRNDNIWANRLSDLLGQQLTDAQRHSLGSYLMAKHLERGKDEANQTTVHEVVHKIKKDYKASGMNKKQVDAAMEAFIRHADEIAALEDGLRSYQKAAGVKKPHTYWGYDREKIEDRRDEFLRDVKAGAAPQDGFVDELFDDREKTLEMDVNRYLNYAAFPRFFDLSTERGKKMFQKWGQSDVQEGYNDMIRDSVLRTETHRWLTKPSNEKFAGKSIDMLLQEGNKTATEDEARTMAQFRNAMVYMHGAGLSQTLRTASNIAMVTTNVLLLPWGVFSQFLDVMQLASRSNNMGVAFDAFGRGLRDMPRLLKGVDAKHKKDFWEKQAEMMGFISAMHLSGYMSDILMGGRTGHGTSSRINDAFFRYNAMAGWQRSMIVAAVKSAHDFLLFHKELPTKQSKQLLDHLGLEPADIKIKNGKITEASDKIKRAVTQYVHEAVGAPDPATLPMWMNDPHFALLAHLKRFTFAYVSWILNRAIKQAVIHKNYAAAVPLVLAVPWMIGVDVVRDLVTPGTDVIKPHWGFMDYAKRGIERAGLLGRAQFGSDVARSVQHGGSGVDALLGPEAQLVGNIAKGTTGGMGRAWEGILGTALHTG